MVASKYFIKFLDRPLSKSPSSLGWVGLSDQVLAKRWHKWCCMICEVSYKKGMLPSSSLSSSLPLGKPTPHPENSEPQERPSWKGTEASLSPDIQHYPGQLCGWANCRPGPPASGLHMTVAWVEILTSTIRETLNRNCRGELLLNHRPGEMLRDDTCCKPRHLGVTCLADTLIKIVNPEIDPKTQRNMLYDEDINIDGFELTNHVEITRHNLKRGKKKSKGIFN